MRRYRLHDSGRLKKFGGGMPWLMTQKTKKASKSFEDRLERIFMAAFKQVMQDPLTIYNRGSVVQAESVESFKTKDRAKG